MYQERQRDVNFPMPEAPPPGYSPPTKSKPLSANAAPFVPPPIRISKEFQERINRNSMNNAQPYNLSDYYSFMRYVIEMNNKTGGNIPSNVILGKALQTSREETPLFISDVEEKHLETGSSLEDVDYNLRFFFKREKYKREDRYNDNTKIKCSYKFMKELLRNNAGHIVNYRKVSNSFNILESKDNLQLGFLNEKFNKKLNLFIDSANLFYQLSDNPDNKSKMGSGNILNMHIFNRSLKQFKPDVRGNDNFFVLIENLQKMKQFQNIVFVAQSHLVEHLQEIPFKIRKELINNFDKIFCLEITNPKYTIPVYFIVLPHRKNNEPGWELAKYVGNYEYDPTNLLMVSVNSSSFVQKNGSIKYSNPSEHILNLCNLRGGEEDDYLLLLLLLKNGGMFLSFDHYKWFAGANIKLGDQYYDITSDFLEIFRANHIINLYSYTDEGARPVRPLTFDYDIQKLIKPDMFFVYILQPLLKNGRNILNSNGNGDYYKTLLELMSIQLNKTKLYHFDEQSPKYISARAAKESPKQVGGVKISKRKTKSIKSKTKSTKRKTKLSKGKTKKNSKL